MGLALHPVDVPQAMHKASAEARVQKAVEGPDDVLSSCLPVIRGVCAVDWQVRRLEKAPKMGRPAGLVRSEQMSTVLGVRLPLVANEAGVDVASRCAHSRRRRIRAPGTSGGACPAGWHGDGAQWPRHARRTSPGAPSPHRGAVLACRRCTH
eukprot:scaffold303173_cov31-Tisochrysis_lutea.AAC.3